MNKQNIYFILLIVITGMFSLLILENFIIVLLLAYIFSVLVSPIHKRIYEGLLRSRFFKKIASSTSSLITILLFLLVIVIPVTILLTRVAADTQSVYQHVISGGFNINTVTERFSLLSNRISPDLNLNVANIATGISEFFVSNIGNVFTGTFDIILKLFLFVIAMFYFLKDGKQFKELYSTISPLKSGIDTKMFESIKLGINSIMIGSITVAIAQGIVTGIGLWIFGVPNPFFFGTLAGFLALIPGIGATAVWLPAAIYLYFTKDGSFVWLYQIIWGVVAVGLIDNILGPKVINKGIKIHPLLILLSIIGGLSVFGPEGFILGPLVLSMFVAIVKLWDENNSL